MLSSTELQSDFDALTGQGVFNNWNYPTNASALKALDPSGGLGLAVGDVYVKYNSGKDLYEIQFFRFRKMEVKYDKVVEDVFAEDLVSVIDGFVG